MGYELVDFKVIASLSRHNSDKDKEHDRLWEDATKRIEEIINDPKYKPIGLISYGLS